MQFNNSHNAPRSQCSNKNVFNCRLNCSKLMSVCLRWTGRLYRRYSCSKWEGVQNWAKFSVFFTAKIFLGADPKFSDRHL